MMSNEAGRRTLVARVDQIATETPQRTWLSIPNDDDDLSKGYRDLTFGQLANAINHAAAWLLDALGSADNSFPTIAYEAGVQDPRIVVFACAAAKVQRKFLPLFQYSAPEVKLYLIDELNCMAFLFADPSSRATADAVAIERPLLRAVTLPPLDVWLSAEPAQPWPYTKPWEQAAKDSWMVLTSSGTTGPPVSQASISSFIGGRSVFSMDDGVGVPISECLGRTVVRIEPKAFEHADRKQDLSIVLFG